MEPDMVGASNYDAFLVIADALKKAKSLTQRAIRDAIAAITTLTVQQGHSPDSTHWANPRNPYKSKS